MVGLHSSRIDQGKFSGRFSRLAAAFLKDFTGPTDIGDAVLESSGSSTANCQRKVNQASDSDSATYHSSTFNKVQRNDSFITTPLERPTVRVLQPGCPPVYHPSADRDSAGSRCHLKIWYHAFHLTRTEQFNSDDLGPQVMLNTSATMDGYYCFLYAYASSVLIVTPAV
jgi:hypothetical protein